ncbi:MAG: tyrosine-protein phosphatase [Bacilli bacterium]|nr:tyrosine-protein phosphatase [Bacilli bacterium]
MNKLFLFSACFTSLIAFSGCQNSVTPIDLGDFTLYTDLQKEYLEGNDPANIPAEATGTANLDKPLPVSFKINGPTAKNYRIDYSYNCRYDDPKINEHTIYTEDQNAIITNLECGKTYYFKVTLNEQLIEQGTFKTNPGPIRILDIDELKNCRDLGGYTTSLGYVKPNLIYRTSELNHAEATFGPDDARITEKGAHTMLNELKVKSEIDLRMESEDIPPEYISNSILNDYGGEVTLKQIRINYGDFKLNVPSHYGEIRDFFAFVANKDNYPIDFHCHIGTDRTGMFAALIRLLLGDSEDGVHFDYMLSNFAYIGGPRDIEGFDAKCLNIIKEYDPSNHELTLAERTQAYLVDVVKVPANDIENMQNILLEKKA